MSVAFNPRIAELVKDLRRLYGVPKHNVLHEAADLIEAFQREVVRISNSSRNGLAASPATKPETAIKAPRSAAVSGTNSDEAITSAPMGLPLWS